MHFINKQDNVTRLADLFQRCFYTFFKITPVFGACHHSGEIHGDDALIPQHLRRLSTRDLQSKALRPRRFTNPGLPDQAGVVFGAPAENLHHALNFGLPANHGIN